MLRRALRGSGALQCFYRCTLHRVGNKKKETEKNEGTKAKKKKRDDGKESDATRPRQQKVGVSGAIDIVHHPRRLLNSFSFLCICLSFPWICASSSPFSSLRNGRRSASLFSLGVNLSSVLSRATARPLCLRPLRPNESLNVTVPVIFLSEQ